jgi:GNAT superfamily N-acetyltransferase
VIERVQAMEPTEPLADVFDIHPLPGSHQVGPFRLDGLLLPHHVPHAGVRLTAPGLALAYSGDAGPDPALAQLGADADLFVIGASLLGAPPEGGNHDLMSAVEAGTWATRAGAKHLLLTHFQPGSDRRLAVAEARTSFPGGQVTAADEGLVLPLAAGLSDPTGGGMHHRYATTADTPAMAALFAASHHDALTEQQRAEQGFVQGDFNAEVLRTMAEGRTLLLAEEDGKPAGFLALAATQDIAVHSPPVQALLAAQGSLCWEGRALSELPWLLYGPVLVDPTFRGRGVARGLYAAALEAASGRAELMVAFIETVNRRSWRVHVEGFGMRPLGEIAAGDRTYSVVAAPVPGA